MSAPYSIGEVRILPEPSTEKGDRAPMMCLATCRRRSAVKPRSPRGVRERIENHRRRPEITGDKTPGQRQITPIRQVAETPLIPSGGREVAGSNPASPTRRKPLSHNRFRGFRHRLTGGCSSLAALLPYFTSPNVLASLMAIVARPARGAHRSLGMRARRATWRARGGRGKLRRLPYPRALPDRLGRAPLGGGAPVPAVTGPRHTSPPWWER